MWQQKEKRRRIGQRIDVASLSDAASESGRGQQVADRLELQLLWWTVLCYAVCEAEVEL